jgi:hypothetical protein
MRRILPVWVLVLSLGCNSVARADYPFGLTYREYQQYLHQVHDSLRGIDPRTLSADEMAEVTIGAPAHPRLGLSWSACPGRLPWGIALVSASAVVAAYAIYSGVQAGHHDEIQYGQLGALYVDYQNQIDQATSPDEAQQLRAARDSAASALLGQITSDERRAITLALIESAVAVGSAVSGGWLLVHRNDCH